MRSRWNRLGGASSLTMLTGVVIIAVNVVTGAVTARGLGVTGRGEYALCLLIPSVLAYVLDLGMPMAVTYDSAGRTWNQQRQQRLLGSGLLVGVLIAAVAVPIAYLYAQARVPSFVAVAVVYCGIFVPTNLVTRFLLASAQGRQQFKKFNAIRILTPALYLVFVLILLSLDRLNVGSCLLATLVANVLALVLLLERAPVAAPQLEDLKAWTRYGIRGHFGNLTPVDAMQLDLVLVGAMLGSYDAGIYAVSATAAMFIRGQGAALGMVAFPRVAAAKVGEQRSIVFRTLWLSLAIHLGLGILCLATASIAVRVLYGPSYADAVAVMRILVVGAVAAGVRQLAGDLLRGLNKPGVASLNELVAWIIGLPLVLILLRNFGLAGVAWGVSLTYVFALLLMCHSLRRATSSIGRASGEVPSVDDGVVATGADR